MEADCVQRIREGGRGANHSVAKPNARVFPSAFFQHFSACSTASICAIASATFNMTDLEESHQRTR